MDFLPDLSSLENWSKIGSVVGGFATLGTLAFAFIAVLVARKQIRAASLVSREAGARQAFRDYLKLCFDEPEFSSTEMFQKQHPSVQLNRILEELTPETERYLWFLTVLLSTCEEIAVSVSSKGKWRQITLFHLRLHADVLRILWPTWRPLCSRLVRSLVEEAIERRAKPH